MTSLDIKRKLIYFLRRENVSEHIIEVDKMVMDSFSIIDNYKSNKLIELCNFAKRNTKYYNNIFNENEFSSKNIDNIFKKIPYLTKMIIRENHEDLVYSKIKGSIRHTSGTTGHPLVFMKDRYASSYMDAAMYNAYSWHGISSFDRQSRLWGSAIGHKDKVLQNLKDFILDRKRLSAFDMNNEKCLSYYNSLMKFRPKYFYCYPNALYQFALSLESQGLSGQDIGISLAICTGEIIYPYHREKIQKIFGCKVISEYGSTENGIIGIECQYGNMHLMPTIYLEVIETDDDGYGQFVVTELNSRSIPFIRYINGDIGRLIEGQCECGRSLQMFEIKEGRVDSYVKCRNGVIVYDAIFAYTLFGFVDQFKAVQKKIDELVIYYKNSKLIKENDVEKKKFLLKKYLGADMQIIFEKVDSIPLDQSGKHRYFISEIE